MKRRNISRQTVRQRADDGNLTYNNEEEASVRKVKLRI